MSLSIGELTGFVDLDYSKAEGGTGKLDGVISGIGGKLKGGLAAVGLLAGTALIAGVKTGMDNEAVNDKLAASLGGTSEDSERYGKIAGKVYSNGFGAGLEDVDAAIGAVVTSIKGMRNASAADVQDMTERAMTFADVMGVDVTRAAQVAGQMVTTGLAKNGKQAFDLLMRTSQKVPVALREDILDATDEYGQFFTQLGIDGPQAMGMLAAGAKKGMYGIDKAGDAVKEFTIRATDMSATSQDAYHKIGLDAGKMANDLLAGGTKAGKATDKIVAGLLGIKDPAERANASIALFGTPLEDLSVKDIPVFLRSLQDGEQSLGKFAGSVDKAGDVAYDNAKTNLSVFARTLKTGFVTYIGDKVLPMVNRFASFIAKNVGPVVKDLGEWVKTKLVPALKDLADEVGDLAKKYMPDVKKAFNDAKPFMKLIGELIVNVLIPGIGKLAKVAIPAMVKQFGTVMKILGAVGKAAVWLWNKAFQPTFRFLANALGVAMKMWGKLLQAIGHVPGMGWVGDLGDKLVNAADKAHRVARAIRDIPEHKSIKVDYFTEVHGKRPGGAGFGPMPALATGGRVTSETIARIGEKEPETVLRDRDILSLLGKAHREGQRVAAESMAGNGRSAPLIGQVVQAPHESADTLAERLWFKTKTRG